MAKYPKEEKERWIEEFKNSGLSITSWANKNLLPVSTVSGWMNRCNKKSKVSNDINFI